MADLNNPSDVFDTSDVGTTVADSSYASTFDTVAPGFTTLIDQQQQTGESWATAAARLLPILAATEQQRQLLGVQVDRARQGLPPLNMSQYAAGVQVGMSSDLKNILVIGGVAALAIMLFGAHRIGR